MRLRQYDPDRPVTYVKLIDTVLHHYGDFRRPEDVVRAVGERRLTDVTHSPEMGSATVQLYEGGDQRVYQFKENGSRGGTIDLLFSNNRLENFRAQLFFEGVLGKAAAAVFSSVWFSRLLNEAVGRNNISFDAGSQRFFCHYGDLVISYVRQVELDIPSLTTSITTRRGCPAGAFSPAREPLRFSPI